MWAMAQTELCQLRRDHRTVAMVVMLPLVPLVVVGPDVDGTPPGIHVRPG
jgi:hypothetical protein